VVVRKPPHMHSAPGSGQGDLCSWVFERYPEVKSAGGQGTRSPGEGGLLHRLDFETSGIVLFARNADAFYSLIHQQELGGFHKEYVAYCTVSSRCFPEGSVPRMGIPSGIEAASWLGPRGRLDAVYLAKLLCAERNDKPTVSCSFRPFGPKGSRVACLRPEPDLLKKAKIVYRSEILDCSANTAGKTMENGSVVLELRIGLSRGFRHQVRAHLAWIGLPIAGDSLYGGQSDERLRLFAVRLSFTHPVSGEAFSLSAEAL
jgi:23S rRNA pseudouridine1911/1915/1917 synthase